jgi:hypothetical protein
LRPVSFFRRENYFLQAQKTFAPDFRIVAQAFSLTCEKIPRTLRKVFGKIFGAFGA